MKTISYFSVSLVLLMIIWWNQPYFGWRYCISKGWLKETDLINVLRPLALSKIKSDGFLEDVALAFDLMTGCVNERGIELCRYAGPDKNGNVQSNSLSNQSSKAQKYRYIVSGISIGVSIVPNEPAYGSSLTIKSYPSKDFESSINSRGLYVETGIDKLISTEIPALNCDII